MKEVNRWWKMLHHSAMLPWHAMASTNPCFKPHIHRRMWKKENMMSSWGQNGRNSSISRHLFSSFGRNPIDFCRWRKSGASLLHRAVRRCEISVVQELLVKEAFGFTRGLSKRLIESFTLLRSKRQGNHSNVLIYLSNFNFAYWRVSHQAPHGFYERDGWNLTSQHPFSPFSHWKLLEAFTRINARDRAGQTALHTACLETSFAFFGLECGNHVQCGRQHSEECLNESFQSCHWEAKVHCLATGVLAGPKKGFFPLLELLFWMREKMWCTI